MLNVNFTGLSGLSGSKDALRAITDQLKKDGGNKEVNNFTNTARVALEEIREASGTTPVTVEVVYTPAQEDDDFFGESQPSFNVTMTDNINRGTICQCGGETRNFKDVFSILVTNFIESMKAREGDEATEANVQRLIDEFA